MKNNMEKDFEGQQARANLSQIRVIDTRRLEVETKQAQSYESACVVPAADVLANAVMRGSSLSDAQTGEIVSRLQSRGGEGVEIAVLGTVGVGAMSNSLDNKQSSLDVELDAPVTNLEPISRFGIVMQPLGKRERIGSLSVMVYLILHALAYFTRKAKEVILRHAGVEDTHVFDYRFAFSSALNSPADISVPRLISRSTSRWDFLSHVRYPGLNDSMSSTVSLSSCRSKTETSQPEDSAIATRLSSFAKSSAGSFGFLSALRNVGGSQMIPNSFKRFIKSFTSASSTTTLGRDESITSGRETMVENVLFMVRSVAQGITKATALQRLSTHTGKLKQTAREKPSPATIKL